MAVETTIATLRSNSTQGTNQVKVGVGSATMTVDATVEAGAAASIGSLYTMMRVPTNTRIHGASRISADDLASTGAPTLTAGLKPVNGNFTASTTVLTSALNVSTAALANAPLIADIANYGKMVWELLGLASDPGGFADVTVSIATAATVEAGTITVTLVYSVD